jgi:hypothetical protein
MKPNIPFDRYFLVVLMSAGCALAQNSSPGVLNQGSSDANRASAHARHSPSDASSSHFANHFIVAVRSGRRSGRHLDR